MLSINKEQFGCFLTQLRKEKGLTQKQLAEKLYISDKAVSKWERGLSLPDISLIIPLAKILDVTATELLSGKRIESDTQLSVADVELLMLFFGFYFTFLAKETLPTYYDENKISFYNDGFFRMNVVGIRFNNSNWKHILKAVHTSIMSVFILFPLLYLAISSISPTLWQTGKMFLIFAAVFSIFIPIYIVGKKYE